jgi:hypothetical protein
VKYIDWSKPATWVFVGFGVEATGALVISLQQDERGVGGFVAFGGAMLTFSAIVVYLIVRARKAIATAKED